MHRDSWRINRIGTTNVFTASGHTIIPSFDRSSIRHYYFHYLFLHWRETCKPCDVIKSKWPREEMSPMIMCLCEGRRRRKVKVRWKNLQSKHNHQYHRIILGNFFISFHRHFKTKASGLPSSSSFFALSSFFYSMAEIAESNLASTGLLNLNCFSFPTFFT